MRRISQFLLAVALLSPALAEAQRPSNSMHTNSAQLYLERGIKADRPDDKKKAFEQALNAAVLGAQQQPGNSKSWFTLGRVYAAMGDAVGADSALDRAETMWPEYAKETEVERFRAYAQASNAAVAQIQANDLAGAAANLEAASKVYNKRPTALLNLGSVYTRLNNREKAIEAYRGALEILQGAARQGLKPEEEKQWAEWEEATSLNLAQHLAFAEKNEEAAAAYEAYLKRNPTNTMIRTNLAVIYSRMGKREQAAATYKELLGQDLPADEYFRVGVGLRRAQQLDQAAVAFQKVIEKNPQMQEAYFNLAYVLWETIQPLEEARSKAKPADAANMAAQLRPMYESLLTSALKAREYDPASRNMLALMQRAYRGLADITKEVKQANEYKLKIPPLIKAYDDLQFEVAGVALSHEGTKATVEGKLINIKAPKGSPIKIRMILLDAAGKEIGSQDINVAAPEVEGEADFKVEYTVAAAPAGWKYEVVK